MRRSRFRATTIAAALFAVLLLARSSAATAETGTAAPVQIAACLIKGNISSSGERIYHVPGQRYYARTIIDLRRGERWFCTEAEAIAAGWRRSKV